MRSRTDDSARWLAQAKEDLKWAAHLAEQGGYYLACFLAQQVAEKALKAFLYAQGEEVVLGHSVGRLSSSAASYDTNFNPKTDHWKTLDTFYIPTRYPNGLPDGIPAEAYNKSTADSAVGLAREVVQFVEKRIQADQG
jgi:HEPN domain-containing protein